MSKKMKQTLCSEYLRELEVELQTIDEPPRLLGHIADNYDRMVAMLEEISGVSCNFPGWWFESPDGEDTSMEEDLESLIK